jgi:hypothetical protein
MWTGVLLLSLMAAAPSARSLAQSSAGSECTSWQECRDQVDAALAAESYHRALDLAWRAVQRGPKDDPSLMFLLARAQTMAGRPQDALVMIRRLAERSVASEALTHPDLARVRDLPGWEEVAPLVARANAGEKIHAEAKPAAASPRTAAATPRNRAPEKAVPRRSGLIVKTDTLAGDTLRFSTDRFVAAGLAYDAVSRRFVLGDQQNRKLRVVGEGLDHAVDLVRAESAGFLEVRALVIDARRGDLWVASSDDSRGASTLHRIQLISGRPLQAVPIGDADRPVRPVDLAVTDAGLVIVLDRTGRLLRGRPGGTGTEVIAESGVEPAFSLALAANDTVAYITHARGIVRVDLGGRRTAEVSSAAELPLTSVERLRRYRDGFIALQRLDDGTRRLLRVQLNRSGSSVREATAYDIRIDAGAAAPALTIAGDEVALVSGGIDATGETGTSPAAVGPPAELEVRRFRLR